MPRQAEDWRRRVIGRGRFDAPAAEAAIRAAYRASDLAEPQRILWARGPREAVRTLRFLAEPPQRQRWIAAALMVIGAIVWGAIAFILSTEMSGDKPGIPLLMIATVLGFYLVREGGRPLPLPPETRVPPSRGGALLGGAAALAAMLGVMLATRHLGSDRGIAAQAVGPALAALAGALPGALLLGRIRRNYAGLEQEMRGLVAGRSVARALWRARRPLLGGGTTALEAHPYQSLVRAHQQAYGDAFLQTAELSAEPEREVRAFGLGRVEPGWAGAPPRSLSEWTLFMPVPHLDGIADAAALQAAEARGSARAQAFADLAFQVDRLFPYRNVALGVLPPLSVELDADGRPHAEDGPALAWADGTEVHAWRGRVVEPDLVCLRPLTRATIAAERDPDRQAVLVERYGLGRYLAESGATAVHADDCGELYRLVQHGEPIVAVHVVNASPEPDGSFRDFWLRVPPNVRTAREAVAWTFGLSEREYQPVAQS